MTTILDVALFATADADWTRVIDPYLSGANYHLSNFDIRLNVYPLRKNDPLGLGISGKVHDRPSDFGLVLLPGDLRAAAAVVLPTPHGMPVIFCRFHRSDAGLTVFTEDTGANRSIGWLNYVLINTDHLNQDRGALLHEIVHAANYSGDTDFQFNRFLHDTDLSSVMRRDPVPGMPITMMDRHAAKLRTAYFARQV